MLRAAVRPCIPNRKIKARIGTLLTPTPTRLHGAQIQMCWCNRTHRRNGNTNKSYQDRSAVYGTICLERGWRHSYKRGRGCVGAARQFTVARRVVRPDVRPSPARRRHFLARPPQPPPLIATLAALTTLDTNQDFVISSIVYSKGCLWTDHYKSCSLTYRRSATTRAFTLKC